MINFLEVCRIIARSAQDWDDTSGFAIRGTRCLNSPTATKYGLEGHYMTKKDQVWSFTAMVAPELPVQSVFGEMAQVWS